jgi:hypothetical protein
MLTLYEYLDTVIDQQCKSDWFFEPRLNYLASEVIKTLEIKDCDEMDSSINRAIQACEMMHILWKLNFKRYTVLDGRNLIDDWKIFSLACYFIVINCNPGYERVPKALIVFCNE